MPGRILKNHANFRPFAFFLRGENRVSRREQTQRKGPKAWVDDAGWSGSLRLFSFFGTIAVNPN